MSDRLTAETLNTHLAAGGVVQVSTYTHSTLYRPKHAGLFVNLSDGSVGVKRGKAIDCLTMTNGRPLCSIRLGRLASN
jgi:hypothetical protein